MKQRPIYLLIAFLGIAGLTAIVYQRIDSRRSSAPPNLPAAETTPARIVSLSPNITEILFALGLGDNIVAVSSDSDFPPEASEKQKVGTFWQPSTEAIIATRPELIITLSFEQHKAAAETLKRLGYKVLVLKINKIEELFTAIQRIGAVTAHERQGDKLVRNIDRLLNDLQSKFSSADKVKVLWVVQQEPLRVVGRNTFVNELMELAGGENAIGATIQRYPPIGGEEILVCGAEVIIQSAMGAGSIDEQQQAAKVFWSTWASVPAVRKNKIYVVDSDTVLRLGPRLPEGVEMIASYLHPEIPAQYNATEQVR